SSLLDFNKEILCLHLESLFLDGFSGGLVDWAQQYPNNSIPQTKLVICINYKITGPQTEL
ncbi:hypothetical protein ACP3WZ_24985, partial [Salmonella enterica]|uniref:hypothetical protein n=1 Tax=Salmonella enterica TaxID=28901 RepID=UPI003CEFA2B3